MAVVIFSGESNLPAEERGFDAGVEVAVLFPCDRLVLKFGCESSGLASVGPGVVVQALPCVVGSEVVVALHSVGDFDRQVAQPRGELFHELFLRHPPRRSDRPEVAPTVGPVESGGAVGTPAGIEIVTVSESVVQPCEPGFYSIVVRVAGVP